MSSLALLASPLLGPSAWEPAARALADRGRPTVTCAAGGSTGSGADVLAALAAGLPDDDVVLVAHSNAGAYVPRLAIGGRVVAVVLVDAILPPRHGEVPLAPPGLLAALRGLADEGGRLPVWDEWWGDTDVARLYPDAATHERVRSEQRHLPVSYFEGTVPVPRGWDDLPAAYLAFGDTYAAEQVDAAGRGWPVRVLAGQHLHLLVAPAEVADALVDLLGVLGIA